jgi:hypothetical protein
MSLSASTGARPRGSVGGRRSGITEAVVFGAPRVERVLALSLKPGLAQGRVEE